MTNREFMQTLDDDHFESTMHYLTTCDFDLADKMFDPVTAVLAWLKAPYDENDKIWKLVEIDNDPTLWDE